MDLSYLISISDGDLEFIQDFIQTFERSTLPQIDQTLLAMENKNYDLVRKLAHQLKPTTELLKFDSHPAVISLNVRPELVTLAELKKLREEASTVCRAIRIHFEL